MNEHGFGDFLDSFRELSAFELAIRTSDSKDKAAEILREYNLSEEFFVKRFPDLAKIVQILPDWPAAQ